MHLRRLLKRIALFCVSFYGVVLLVMISLENSLIYPAPKYPSGNWSLPPDTQEAWFQSEDGTKLHGWLVRHPQPKAVILYLHGNGDSVGHLGSYLRALRDKFDVSIMAFDYRGYGRSEGSPFEKGVLADSHAAREWLCEAEDLKPDEVVLMGRSLGGAVAIDLAAKGGARGLVLQSTFTSMPEVAARLYPWLPVRWLMRTKYASLKKIASCHAPILLSHGTADRLVPFEMGQRLFDAAPGEKEMFVIDGGGHNDFEPREYYVALQDFLDRITSPAARETISAPAHSGSL